MRYYERKYFISIVTSIIISLFVASANGTNWYVDKVATGSGNGGSWDNAWTTLGTIVWSSINPGDTIYISGGSLNKTYNEQLTVGKSGAAGNIVTISTGQDLGHNGTVIIDGQSSRSYAVYINGRSYIKMTGQVGTSQNMKLTGGTAAGLYLDGAVTNTEIAYLEVASNGTSSDTNGITGRVSFNANRQLEIHHCLIHDNYQDGINMLQTNAGAATQYGTVRVHHNTIYNVNDDGIETSLPIDFYNNEVGPRIYSGGRGHPDGIQFYNSYSRVYNNYFHGFVLTSDPGNSNSNIFFDPFDPDITINPHDVQIFNNLLVELQPPGSSADYHRGIAVKFAEPGVASANNILIANNTIVGTPFFGMTLTFGSLGTENVSNVLVENNIWKDTGRNGGAVLAMEKGNGSLTYGSHGSGADVVVDYNLVDASSGTYATNVQWNNTFYSFANYKTASGADSHGFVANPSLDGSYGLNVGSPAIDKGVSLSSYFTTDKSGTSRPKGSAWDIGAYESNPLIPQFPSDIQVR